MPESATEGATGLPEGSDIGLGAGCRGFKSLHSDQNPSEIIDFRGVFLFFGYCGAEFEIVILNISAVLVCFGGRPLSVRRYDHRCCRY